jgi:hypothetical protein
MQVDKVKRQFGDLDVGGKQPPRSHRGASLEGDPDQPIIIGRNQSFLGPQIGDYSGNAVVASEGWDEVPEDVMFPRARTEMTKEEPSTSTRRNFESQTSEHLDLLKVLVDNEVIKG